jgi:ligand-binding sensor domain-containing protein
MKNNLVTILLFLTSCLNAQQIRYGWRNFTTNDGLPSPEVYTVIQDSKGFLWFGTDNGVSRYDGYTFQNFGAQEGLTNNVINCIQEDAAGRIWLGSMWGPLFYFENGTIHPFKYNHLIEAYQKSFFVNAGFSRFEKKENTDGTSRENREGCVLVGLVNVGILKIYDNGQSELIAASKALSLLAFPSNKKNIVVTQALLKGVYPPNILINRTLFIYDGQKLVEQGIFNANSLNDVTTNARLIAIGKSNYLFTNTSMHRQNEQGPFSDRPYERPIYDVLTDEDGLIWTAEGLNGGVKAYPNAEAIGKSPPQIVLEGISGAAFLRDRAGGYWVTTLGQGVFYLRDKRLQIFDKNNTAFPFDALSSVESFDKSKVFLGFEQGEVGIFDKTTSIYQPIQHLSKDIIYDMKWDNRLKQLWFGGLLLKKWQNGQLKTLENTNKETEVYGVKKIAVRFQKDAAWVICAKGLRQVTGLTAKVWFEKSSNAAKNRLFSVFEDSKQRVWIGKQDGLYSLEKDSLVAVLPLIHTALTARVEAIAELPNGSLVFATKGNGLVIWDGTHAVNIRKTDGLQTDMLENVATDALGNIWVGTLAGLHKLSPPTSEGGNTEGVHKSRGQWHVQPITMFQGLPSNEINDIAPITPFGGRGGVFIATPKGLVFYQDKPANASVEMPFLDYFKAGNSNRDLSKTNTFDAGDNDMEIAWHCINFQMLGKILYRFRLNANDAWRYTYNRNIQAASLSSGHYDFEVQAQNEAGEWSASLKAPFYVKPYWFEAWWFRVLCIVLASLGGYLFYMNRIQNLQKEHAIALQINDLERSALATQMNPHFIFNCLNSIQLLIQRGEREEAMSYLSRFAKMVRFILESTRRGKVTVEEEVQALTNYLTLEKLRFKEDLTFSIVTNSAVDAYSIEIPAMLIQPFVENALKHGFDSSKKMAEINVFFEVKNDFLNVEIRDNGKGFNFGGQMSDVGVILPKSEIRNPKYTEGGHIREKTGVGIHLSQQRLALHNGRTDQKDLQIETILAENKSVLGTSVRLKIRLITILQ